MKKTIISGNFHFLIHHFGILSFQSFCLYVKKFFQNWKYSQNKVKRWRKSVIVPNNQNFQTSFVNLLNDKNVLHKIYHLFNFPFKEKKKKKRIRKKKCRNVFIVFSIWLQIYYCAMCRFVYDNFSLYVNFFIYK